MQYSCIFTAFHISKWCPGTPDRTIFYHIKVILWLSAKCVTSVNRCCYNIDKWGIIPKPTGLCRVCLHDDVTIYLYHYKVYKFQWQTSLSRCSPVKNYSLNQWITTDAAEHPMLLCLDNQRLWQQVDYFPDQVYSPNSWALKVMTSLLEKSGISNQTPFVFAFKRYLFSIWRERKRAWAAFSTAGGHTGLLLKGSVG